ncbi:hypothetical protein Tco_1093783 [Tanacetum coccineum]|uniref:Uncharacterized protein n=1 Tax=Tanacetum coccineum TaxID=301880 RepID=A0ABQ5IEZ4_9ASTR
MESVSVQVVAATKLPVLNPGEFELWKMRIEQYFLMTDYALWEVILNGGSPLPTRTVDGVETSAPPTTVKQKLARKNELKARAVEKSLEVIRIQIKYKRHFLNSCMRISMERAQKDLIRFMIGCKNLSVTRDS